MRASQPPVLASRVKEYWFAVFYNTISIFLQNVFIKWEQNCVLRKCYETYKYEFQFKTELTKNTKR